MAGAGFTNLWILIGLGIAGIFMATRKFKKIIKEDFGAFLMKFQLLPPPQPAPPKAPHPLTALTFAVSDMYVFYTSLTFLMEKLLLYRIIEVVGN